MLQATMAQQKPPNKKNNLKNVAMLSGIAFEMGAIIFLAAKGGIWLDEHYQTDKRIFTAIPPTWKVLSVNCVPGSPIDCAATTPCAVS